MARRKEFKKLINTDIYENVLKSNTNDSDIGTIIYFLLAVLFYIFSIIPYNLIDQFINDYFALSLLRLWFYLAKLISAFCLSKSFLRFMKSKILKIFFSEDFITFYTKKRNYTLSFIFIFILYTIIIYLTDLYAPLTEAENEFKDFLITTSIVISSSMMCFLVSQTIIDYLDYLSYTLNYKDRILDVKMKMYYLEKINNILPEEIYDVNVYARKLFNRIINISMKNKYNSGHISEEESEEIDKKGIHRLNRRIKKSHVLNTETEVHNALEGKILDIKGSDPENIEKSNSKLKNDLENIKKSNLKLKNVEDTISEKDFTKFLPKKLFYLLDLDKNGILTKHEFILRYCYLFKEHQKLKQGLDQNKTNMFKLQILINLLFIPFIIFTLLAATGQLTSITESFTIAGLIIFPFTFAFKSVIEDVFTSCIFVFFMKPFDIGDIFLLSAKNKYEVINIGVLYSDFLLNGKFVTLKNTYFNDKQIFNLRKSDYITKVYKLKFGTKNFLEKEVEFVKKLDIFFNNIQSSSYKLYNYTIIKNNILIDLETSKIVPYQEIDTLEEQDDRFIIYLNHTIKELGLE